MVEFERYRSDNYELNRVQDKVEDFARGVQLGGIVNGRLVENVELIANQTNMVYHGLGRRYKGYIVVSINEKVVVQVVDADNLSPEKYIPLTVVTYPATASLWVF